VSDRFFLHIPFLFLSLSFDPYILEYKLVKYSAERELRVLQIVKELKLVSKLDVEERYRELFKEDLEETGLILRRGVARGALTTQGEKYKMAKYLIMV
jgi:hypothetical protein